MIESLKILVEVGVLTGEEILYSSDDIGNSFNDVSNLLDRIGAALFGNVDEINCARGVNYEKSYGRNRKTCSAATAEVLRTGLSLFLGVIVDTAGCYSHGNLGNRNNCDVGRGNDGVSDNGVRVYERADILH